MATYERKVTGSIPGASTSIPEESREVSGSYSGFSVSHERSRKEALEQAAALAQAAVGQPAERYTVEVSAADMAVIRFLLTFMDRPDRPMGIEACLGAAIAAYCGFIGPTLRPDPEPEPKPKKARKVRP